jgi:hypothetical protein
VTGGFASSDAADNRAIKHVDYLESPASEGNGYRRFFAATLASTLDAGNGRKNFASHRD